MKPVCWRSTEWEAVEKPVVARLTAPRTYCEGQRVSNVKRESRGRGAHVDVRVRDTAQSLKSSSDTEDLGSGLSADDGRDVGCQKRDSGFDVLEDLLGDVGSANAQAAGREHDALSS